MNNLKQIAAFLKVVELGNFTAAAAELGLSSSAVSKYVSQLEAELGVQLLLRTTRHLTLTDVGSNYFDQCSIALKQLHSAAVEAMRRDSQLRGPLRVIASPGVGHRLLLPAIMKFMSLYPDISISLSVGEVPANVPAGDELVVTMTSRGEARGTSVQSTELVDISYLVCASPDYIAAFGRPLKPEDLKRHNCLIQERQRTPRDWRFSQDNGKSISVKVDGSFVTNTALALEEAVLAGKGIGRLPDYMARRHVERKRLVVLFDNLLTWGASCHCVLSERAAVGACACVCRFSEE